MGSVLEFADGENFAGSKQAKFSKEGVRSQEERASVLPET
jgi:hypothetical protein